MSGCPASALVLPPNLAQMTLLLTWMEWIATSFFPFSPSTHRINIFGIGAGKCPATSGLLPAAYSVRFCGAGGAGLLDTEVVNWEGQKAEMREGQPPPSLGKARKQ